MSASLTACLRLSVRMMVLGGPCDMVGEVLLQTAAGGLKALDVSMKSPQESVHSLHIRYT